jgi:antitoxin (DNA-binding transcriptional repressor) of toxin-antitoxin stability system
MQVSITRFRRDIFALVSQALEGDEVWITHKGTRLQIVPEARPATRLGRIAPIAVVNSREPEATETALQDEMQRAWEQDWAAL